MDEGDVSTASGSSGNLGDNGLKAGVGSSFIGNRVVKRRYEERLANYDPNVYWRIHDLNLQVVAAQAIKRAPHEWPTAEKRRRLNGTVALRTTENENEVEDDATKDRQRTKSVIPAAKGLKPFNPYEGVLSALQLDESLSEFLSRLLPSQSPKGIPWIWVANFHSTFRPLDENVPVFRQRGTELLAAYRLKKRDLESRFPEKQAGAITRMLTPDRKRLESDIRNLAKQYSVKTGKWMLFPHPSKVDEVWAAVVSGTVDGRLGCAAKVATTADRPDEPSHLVCIYTEDFSDTEDVKRVLKEMEQTDLIETAGHGTEGAGRAAIYYKCDAYTHLDITSQNEYKLRASMYSSKDLIAEMKLKGEL